MKKILLAILLCIATLFAFSATVFAEEGDAVADPTVQTETSTEEPATPSEDNSHTLFTRIWEFVNEHKTDTLSLAGEALILGLAFLLKRKMDKSSAVAKETKDGVEATRGGQSSVVDAVNRMIDGYNNMKESFDINGALESDKNRVVNALVAQTAAILEILTTAYAHSKLPQGVKDLVTLKYANCMKAIQEDEHVKAVIEAVRNNVGAPQTTPSENEADEAAKE